VDFGFTCTCGEELIAEIVIDYGGHPGTMPSLYYPGDPPEGAEYHLESPVKCEDDEWTDQAGIVHQIKGCGKVWDDEAIYEAFDEKIQEQIADRDPPEPDYDY
jgi:hypothetical protein